jgi:hypothetical protein
MIKYVICVIISYFLIQTAAAATDPDYFGFIAGTQANTTDNSQNMRSEITINQF